MLAHAAPTRQRSALGDEVWLADDRGTEVFVVTKLDRKTGRGRERVAVTVLRRDQLGAAPANPYGPTEEEREALGLTVAEPGPEYGEWDLSLVVHLRFSTGIEPAPVVRERITTSIQAMVTNLCRGTIAGGRIHAHTVEPLPKKKEPAR